MKLTKRHKNVLNYLSSKSRWAPRVHIPDGNGHASGGHNASGETMSELMKLSLVEYGKESQHSFYGYRITDAGRAALKEMGE